MEIKKALEPTGKAIKENVGGRYVEEDTRWVLYWFNQEGEMLCPVALSDIQKVNWQPYHEKKEIRPERDEELWEKDGIKYFTVNYCVDDITFIDGNNHHDHEGRNNAVHNQNGWKRLHPPVEDESVERVVIEDVTCSNSRIAHNSDRRHFDLKFSTHISSPEIKPIFYDKVIFEIRRK